RSLIGRGALERVLRAVSASWDDRALVEALAVLEAEGADDARSGPGLRSSALGEPRDGARGDEGPRRLGRLALRDVRLEAGVHVHRDAVHALDVDLDATLERRDARLPRLDGDEERGPVRRRAPVGARDRVGLGARRRREELAARDEEDGDAALALGDGELG